MSTVIRPSTTIFYTIPQGQNVTIGKNNINACDYSWVEFEILDGTGTIEQLDQNDNVIGTAQARPGIKLRVNVEDWPEGFKYRFNGPVTLAMTGWRYIKSTEDSLANGAANVQCAQAVSGGVKTLTVKPAPAPIANSGGVGVR